MSIPPEVAWIVPIVLPFIIGLLLGAVIKRALKLLFFIIVLVVFLVFTGVLSITFSGLFKSATEFLPMIFNFGHGWLNVLPYTSLAFLIGLVIGLVFT
jgi:uncharacterized membrane protein (Fun14 family)